jgi:hypothetical protein
VIENARAYPKLTDDVRVQGRWRVLAFILVAGLALSGCAGWPDVYEAQTMTSDDSPEAVEARQIVTQLQNANAHLKNFKGLGRLTVRKEGKVQMDDRIAWIGSEPLKLSLVLFASGFPALRMAGDGEWLYYQDVQAPEAPVKRIRASDPDFKRLLSIAIQSSDIISLMCGRIPIREHRSATLKPLSSGKGYALMLTKPGVIQQAIFLDETKSEVRQTLIYDSSGDLLFQADFMEMQLVDGYKVPLRLAVSNSEQALVQLVVERYWADVPVTPAMFTLGPTG